MATSNQTRGLLTAAGAFGLLNTLRKFLSNAAHRSAVEPIETTASHTGETEKSGLNVELKGDEVIIGGKAIPRSKLNEVQFKQKGRNHFNVVARIFRDGTGAFSKYAGIDNTVVGLVDSKEAAVLERKLAELDISTFYLGRY